MRSSPDFRGRPALQRRRERADFAVGTERGARRLDYEIIFVDDGSSDQHRRADRARPKFGFCGLRKMPGKARRFMPGFEAARGATAVLIDGDLQNDPADIPSFSPKSRAAPISSAAIARSARTRWSSV